MMRCGDGRTACTKTIFDKKMLHCDDAVNRNAAGVFSALF
jgi:hypothetical protein